MPDACEPPLFLSFPPDLDYLFGVYSGILFSSTFYMFAYSAISANKPKIYPNLVFPGIISGIMWGIAMGKRDAV